LALVFGLGCSSLSTQKGFYEPITVDLTEGEYDSAVVKIEIANKKNKWTNKDRFLYYLDAGLANHYAAAYDTSNVRLTQAEEAAEELYTKSISRAAASILLNDNVLAYSGEDYEILYTNLFKALNYVSLGKFDDAFVEIRRANLKLELLEQKYADAAAEYQQGLEDDTVEIKIPYEVKKVRFNSSAFARYLSMHIYAADGQYDDARIDYEALRDAYISQPYVYNFDMPDVDYNSRENAIVSFVVLAGLSPVKDGLSLRIRTDKDLDLVQVLYDGAGRDNEEYGHFPIPISEDYYFKFAIPVIVSRPSKISFVRVIVDGTPLGELQLLEDVGQVARETFEAKKSLIYIRSVIRAVAKGLITHKMKQKADTGGVGGWLKKAAIDVGQDLIENADLRCSRLLPGKILVGDFEFEPGIYNFVIEFYDYDGNLIDQVEIPDYNVKRYGLNMLQAFSFK
jgi:hypothetical protein